MSATPRAIEHRFPGAETMEGAGVRLRRAFGNREVPLFDPFLLLDNFGSSNPEDYVAGFPWHPHRGIETVTYMLDGEVDHGDSLGNSGTIGAGDVQWMTSGSGIIHQEMPRRSDHLLRGFQLWVNIPARSKMERPAYRGLSAAEFPVETTETGAQVRVVAGKFGSVEGPVKGLPVDPAYFDVTLPPEGEFRWSPPKGYTAFAHTVEGPLTFGAPGAPPLASKGETVLFGPGDHVDVRAGPDGGRLLLVSGRPLHEPVAWYGPIVMNAQSELSTAIRELREGTFVKEKRPLSEE